MGKSKKNLEDLKKDLDLKPIKKDDLNKIVGGKNDKNKNNKWNNGNGCGGIVPQ